MCCSVLQSVAVCYSVLQCVAVSCSVLQCVAVCFSVLQCVVDVSTVPFHRVRSTGLRYIQVPAYAVAKTHSIPYLYTSLPAKEDKK